MVVDVSCLVALQLTALLYARPVLQFALFRKDPLVDEVLAVVSEMTTFSEKLLVAATMSAVFTA